MFLKSVKRCCFNQRIARYLSSHPKISTISEIYSVENTGQIQIQGWIKSVRKMKELLFLDVNDGSCAKNLQIVVEKSQAPNELSYGASISASGSLHTNKNNQLEVLVDNIRVFGKCDVNDNYPFTPRMQYNPNHQREFIHLRPRTNSFSSLLRIRHKSELLVNNILDEYGFFNIDVPVLTTNDCEGGGEVFSVKPDNKAIIKDMISEVKSKPIGEDEVFFNNKTYLTVSGQLHLEAASRALKNVYRFGPTFRAENSKSRLHLSEFYMLETEMAFINDIKDITNMLERFLKSLIDNILNGYSEEIHQYLKSTNVNTEDHLDVLNKIINQKFLTITYDDAFEILNKESKRFKSRPRKGESFGKEHELFLVEHNDKIPIFVVEWPAVSKPFYMKSMEESPHKVEGMDLLCVNVGELCGGGVREDNYDRLEQKIKEANFDKKLDWYLDLRRYGNITTGGFGMGFERFLQLLLGTQNIKDTIPFPRWPHNCKL